MYKAIIFDFFGVFCPDLSMNWFCKTAKGYKAKLPEFHAICTQSDYGRLSRADFCKQVSALAGISVDEMVQEIEAETKINDSLVNYVKELRQNYQIACLSNGSHEWTIAIINDHGLAHLFDEVVLSADIGIVKPNPEVYAYTLEKLGIKTSEAIFVDDRKVNVDAAEACGIRSLLFSNTETFIKEFEQILTTS